MDLNPPNTEGVVSDQGLESWEEAPPSRKLTSSNGSEETANDAPVVSTHTSA